MASHASIYLRRSCIDRLPRPCYPSTQNSKLFTKIFIPMIFRQLLKMHKRISINLRSPSSHVGQIIPIRERVQMWPLNVKIMDILLLQNVFAYTTSASSKNLKSFLFVKKFRIDGIRDFVLEKQNRSISHNHA